VLVEQVPVVFGLDIAIGRYQPADGCNLRMDGRPGACLETLNISANNFGHAYTVFASVSLQELDLVCG